MRIARRHSLSFRSRTPFCVLGSCCQHHRSVGRIVLTLAVEAGLLAACGSTAGVGSMHRQLNVSVEPKSRLGQLPLPAGRSPTRGPQSFHSSTIAGVQLDMVNALLDGTSVFNGDFADPFALKTSQALYRLLVSDSDRRADRTRPRSRYRLR